MIPQSTLQPAPTSTPVPDPTPEPAAPEPATPGPATPEDRTARLKSALPSLALNILVPTAAYFVLEHRMDNTSALMLSGAIPTAFTIAGFIRARRISALGLLSIAGFAVAVAMSALSGGSPLAFELQDPLLTGTVGLALLISVVMRKPLLLVGVRMAAQTNPALVDQLAKPSAAHRMTVLTTIVGATLALHSTALTLLALTRSTGTYVAMSKPIGLPILAAGLAVMVLYRRRGEHAPVSI